MVAVIAEEWFLAGIAASVGWLSLEVRRAIRRGEKREDMMLKALLGKFDANPDEDDK